MSDLEAKITITAVDHASAVVSRIGASLAGLKAATMGVGAAWNNVSNAGGQLARKLAVVSIAAVAAGGAVWGLTKHYAELSEQLSLSSQKSGVSVESLQRLQFSAKLANIETGKLDTGLKFLNKNMAASLVTSSGKKGGGKENAQAKAFKELGINVKDTTGKMKTADQVVLEMADKFHTMTNAAEKVRLAQALLGRAGTDLVPILNQGSEAIKKQGDELQKLGHILSSKEIEDNKHFAEDLKKLNVAVSGLGAVIASALIPVVTPLVEDMTNWIAANKEWLAGDIKDGVIAFGGALKTLWGVLGAVKAVIWPVISALGGLKTVIIVLAGGYIASLAMSFINLMVAIGGLVKAVWLLNFAFLASPIFWIIAGVVALGVALYELIAHFDAVKAAVMGFWERLPQGAKNAIRTMVAILTGGFSEVAIAIYKNMDKISAVWDGFKQACAAAMDWVVTKATAIWARIKGVFDFSSLNPFKSEQKTTIPLKAGEKSEDHSSMWEKIKSTSSSAWDGVSNATTAAWNGISSATSSAFNAIGSAFSGLKSLVMTGVQSLVPAFQSFAQVVVQAFSTLNSLLGSTVAGINNVKSALAGVHAPNISMPGTASVPSSGHPGAAAPSVGKTAMATTSGGQYAMLSPQTQKVDIHMKIDSDGRPKQVSAKTNNNAKFSANTGVMV